MRLIDADAFKRYVQEGYETTKEMFHGKYRELVDAVTKGLLNDIDEQPTIKPQPEIIRCKDCKHYIKNITCVGGHYNGCAAWSDNGNEIAVGPDDYCSYAERRTDG